MAIEHKDEDLGVTLNPAYSGVSGDVIQEELEYLRILEAHAQNKATQEDIDALTRRNGAGWWEENKQRFIDECSSRSITPAAS